MAVLQGEAARQAWARLRYRTAGEQLQAAEDDGDARATEVSS